MICMSRLQDAFDRHAQLLERVRQLDGEITRLAEAMISTLDTGHKILLCGNGGSAADAQHIAAELTGRFLEKDRRPLPAVALTTDSSALTAISNDFGFESVFSRQVEALGVRGDLVLGLSTSGNSPNVIAALESARKIGCVSAALTGGDGGRARQCSDICLVVPSPETPRIQEMHILIAHILCDLIDQRFLSK
jgi:D-sedoheptulose 7-phosphate isomerase